MTAPLPTASRWNTYSRSRYPGLWDGCVGAWCPSLGVSGARLADASRFGNWATLTNMDPATDWVVSGGGYALDFDGKNDQAVASVVMIGKNTEMTLACWANITSTIRKGAFMMLGIGSNAVNDGIGIGVGASTFDGAGNNIVGAYEGVRWLSTSVPIGTGWHHFALVVNKTGQPIIYMDGAQVYTDGASAPNPITVYGAVNLGGYNSSFGTGYPRYFADPADDWRAYDRILHPEEIRILARRRAIAYEPEYWVPPFPEQAAGGITSRPYAYQSARMIGAGR